MAKKINKKSVIIASLSIVLIATFLFCFLVQSIIGFSFDEKTEVVDTLDIQKRSETESQKKIYLSYLNQNKHISFEEKKTLVVLGDFLEDYPLTKKEFINFCLKIKNVSIIYKENDEAAFNGIYTAGTNVITIYRNTPEKMKKTLVHESFHLLSFRNKQAEDYGVGFNEGMTEILAQEYYDNKNNSYPLEVLLIKKITEKITPEEIVYAYLNNDIDYIVTKLNINKELFIIWDKLVSNNYDPKSNNDVRINILKEIFGENMDIQTVSNKNYFIKSKH